MPAHRSDAEAEIRQAVVQHLRLARPEARIMHEVNIASRQHRVDVMAGDRAEIIMIEIKSERDKLDRLADQMAAMRRSAHIVGAALHRKFMPEGWEERPLPARLDGISHRDLLWWHPKAQDMAEAQHPALNWRVPDPHAAMQVALPQGALAMLHRDELERVCQSAGISLPRNANMKLMEQVLRWGATGRQITLGICEQLRRRTLAAEADYPIREDAS